MRRAGEDFRGPPPAKQANNRYAVVAALGLTVQSEIRYQGQIRPQIRAVSLDLKGMVGRRTPAVVGNKLRDHGSTVVACEHHRSLEALRARDEDAETVMERIGGDPRFVRRADTFAATTASDRMLTN